MKRHLDACRNLLPSATWQRRSARRSPAVRSFAVWLMTTATAGAWLGGGAPLRAQAVCAGSNISYFGGGTDGATPTACANGIVCQVPIVTSGPTYSLDSGCDPTAATCGMTVTIGMHFTGNHCSASAGTPARSCNRTSAR